MTSTIPFWIDIMLNNNLPKIDDHIHPTLDDYCSFCSLYKKSVSFSSKFGRISHVILKLPKVEENRSIIFFHFWNWTIYGTNCSLHVDRCNDLVVTGYCKVCLWPFYTYMLFQETFCTDAILWGHMKH